MMSRDRGGEGDDNVIYLTDGGVAETDLLTDRVESAIFTTVDELAKRNYYYSKAEVIGILEIMKLRISEAKEK